MKTIFDFGMCDASDTEYYLSEGYKVVAVEANPALAKRAEVALAQYIGTGQLTIVNAAIATDSQEVVLTISGDDLGSSSIYEEKVSGRVPLAQFKVQGITTETIFERFGVPYYLKIDIEGADRLPVLALTAANKPAYLSFEIGEEFEKLLGHLTAVGYSEFRAINQCNLRDLVHEDTWSDKLAMKIIRVLGYNEPLYARRAGRYFKLGYSSGPVPWSAHSGWFSSEELMRAWLRPKASDGRNVWYDLHAR